MITGYLQSADTVIETQKLMSFPANIAQKINDLKTNNKK